MRAELTSATTAIAGLYDRMPSLNLRRKPERTIPRENARPLETEIAFGGEMDTVLRNFKRKAEMLRDGDPDHKRIVTAVVIGPGVQRGVVPAGNCVAMEDLKFTDQIDHWVGVSTGAFCVLRTVAKQARVGAEFYFKHNIKNRLIDKRRAWRGVVDMKGLEKSHRIDVPVDLRQIENSRGIIHIGVTDIETGLVVYPNSKDGSTDLISATIASGNLPLLSNIPYVEINGIRGGDGGVGDPLPIEHAVKKLGATDVLVMLSHPLEEEGSPLIECYRRFNSWGLTWGLSPKFKEMIETNDERYKEATDYAMYREKRPRDTKVNIGVSYPRSISVDRLSMDSTELERTYNISLSAAKDLFSGYIPRRDQQEQWPKRVPQRAAEVVYSI